MSHSHALRAAKSDPEGRKILEEQNNSESQVAQVKKCRQVDVEGDRPNIAPLLNSFSML